MRAGGTLAFPRYGAAGYGGALRTPLHQDPGARSMRLSSTRRFAVLEIATRGRRGGILALVTANSPDLDAVLAHADWLGRLSRQLCRDQHAADDAAQEALLASLRSPPRHDGNLRAFLANVLRNVLRLGHRADGRRRRREANVPPPDFAEAADLAAARAEVHQTLGRLVLELPEPQRALVLLCYFEGQDVGEVAARSGMTRDAVQGHLRRARDTLRTRLQSNGGARRGSAALLLLDRRLWLAQGALMTITLKTKLAAAAVAAAAAAVCLWTLPDVGSPPPRSQPSADESVLASVDVDVPAPTSVLREQAPTEPVTSPPPAPASPRGLVTGTVVDFAGKPVAAVPVHLLPLRDGKPTTSAMRATTDAHGRFELVTTVDGEAMVVAVPVSLVPVPGETSQVLRVRRDLAAASVLTAVARDHDTAAGEIRLPQPVFVQGIVRTPGQVPVAGVSMHWWPDQEEWEVTLEQYCLGSNADGAIHIDIGDPRSREFTDADGRFLLPAAAGAPGYLVALNAGGNLERLIEPRRLTAPTDVVFDLLAPVCVRVLAQGQPAARVWITFDKDLGSYPADAAGEVRVQRERAENLRGRITLPGREPFEFDVPATSCPEQPTIVELGAAPPEPPATLVQVTITSERAIGAVNCSLMRLDQRAGPVFLKAEPGSPVTMLSGRAPPGKYRLVLYPGGGGDDAFVLRHVQEIDVGSEPAHVAIQVRHGGLIRCAVRNRDGLVLGGKVRLVRADGTELRPEFENAANGVGAQGYLWSGAPSVTASHRALPAGRYEFVVEVRDAGTYRQFVDVRACEVADVTITPP